MVEKEEKSLEERIEDAIDASKDDIIQEVKQKLSEEKDQTVKIEIKENWESWENN